MKKIFKNNWILAYKKQGMFHLIISGYEIFSPTGERFESIERNNNYLVLKLHDEKFSISLNGPILNFSEEKRGNEIKKNLERQTSATIF